MPENDFYNNNIVFRSIARLDLMKIVQVYVYFCLSPEINTCFYILFIKGLWVNNASYLYYECLSVQSNLLWSFKSCRFLLMVSQIV